MNNPINIDFLHDINPHWGGGFQREFGTSEADVSAENVTSLTVVPEAGAGTMSISTGGQLSMLVDGTWSDWASSITYVVGARVKARGDASDEYEDPTTFTITGVDDFIDTYIVLTNPEVVEASIADRYTNTDHYTGTENYL